VQLWNAENGRRIRTLKGHTGPVSAVRFSPDGQILASVGASDNTVRLWELATGRELRAIEAHAFVTTIDFSPDGRRLVAGNWSTAVPLWDVQTGQEVSSLRFRAFSALAVGFSPDGHCLATGDNQGMVRLWDARSVQPIRTLQWEPGTITSVGLSDDGKRIVARGTPASEENSPDTLLAWNADTGLACQPGTDAPPPKGQQMAVAANERISAWINGGQIHMLRREDADEARKLDRAIGQEWHLGQALEAETIDDWFAAAYHLAWLTLAEREDAATPPPAPSFLAGEHEVLLHMATRALENQEPNADYLGALGAALYAGGEHDKAVELLARAVLSENVGRTAWMQFYLAMAHHRLGHLDEGRRWFEQAIRAEDAALSLQAAPLLLQALRTLGSSDGQPLSTALSLGVPPALLPVPGIDPPGWQPPAFRQLRQEARAVLKGGVGQAP
jgi:tetratricopeptide (TPR) repeat protein